jgi:hypothetical protein
MPPEVACFLQSCHVTLQQVWRSTHSSCCIGSTYSYTASHTDSCGWQLFSSTVIKLQL